MDTLTIRQLEDGRFELVAFNSQGMEIYKSNEPRGTYEQAQRDAAEYLYTGRPDRRTNRARASRIPMQKRGSGPNVAEHDTRNI